MIARLALAFFILAADAAARLHAQQAREIAHQGVERRGLIVNAEAAKEAPKPIWLVLHGRRDPAAEFRTSPVLDAIARREGLVAVYPEALSGRWSTPGQATSRTMVGAVPADDVGFLAKLIDALIAEKVADRRRVYVSGASMGGAMAYALMCAASERLAAAAPMIASMTEAQIALCKPPRAVPIAVIAGTDDVIVPYDGWLFPQHRLTSVPETMDFWRRLHGCTGQRGSLPTPQDRASGTQTVRLEWTACKIEGAVRAYRIQGGGHTLPSLTPHSPEEEKKWGRRSSDFETSEELWTFFRRWSL